jgi:hypothetical protein
MVTTLITSPFALVTSLDSFTTPVTRLGGGNHPGYHPGERAVQFRASFALVSRVSRSVIRLFRACFAQFRIRESVW